MVWVNWDGFLLEDWWFNSQPLQSVCQSVLGQDTEPKLNPQMCVYVFLTSLDDTILLPLYECV